MKKHVKLLAAAGSMAGLLWGNTSEIQAQTAGSTEDLKAQIRELGQQLKILERKLEAQEETRADKAKSAPTVSAGASGIVVRSADSNFVFGLRGYVQADGRFYPDNPNPGTIKDTFLLRRVRPVFEGTVYQKYDYKVMLDLGQGNVSSSTVNNTAVVQDAYVNARLWPEFQIQIGKFKEPVGLERLQTARNLLFVERGLPTLLVPNRDTGIMLQGNLLDEKLNYSAGVFNGVTDAGSNDFDTDREKDLAARLFARPFKDSPVSSLRGLGVGVSGTLGHREGALRALSITGVDNFFAFRTGVGTNDATANVVAGGQQWRVSPQAYYYWGPFGLLAEYVISDEKIRRDSGVATYGRFRNTAWQVAASYILTGEDNGFEPLKPRRPFSLGGGGWGAWEVAGRIGQLDVDNAVFPLFANPATSASGITEWALGLNWHINSNLKLNLNYSQADYQGGDSNPLLRKGLKTIYTRVQVVF